MILNKIKINDTATVTPGVVYDISKATGQSYETLSDALSGNNVPPEVREGGMSIRYVLTSDNKYVQYRLAASIWSTDVHDWTSEDPYFVDKIMQEVNKAIDENTPIEIHGDVTNAPDEEDLTSVNQGGTDVLKFKDKTYNPLTYSGMGRIILRKNIVSGVNTLTQSMMQATNTIYVILYDFTLGEDITIPENCVLEFDGGSISGTQTLTGNNTSIEARLVKIFNTDIILAGSWNIVEAYPEWFGAKGDGMTDDRFAIQKCLTAFKKTKLSNSYKLASFTDTTNNICLIMTNGTTLEGDYVVESHVGSQNLVIDDNITPSIILSPSRNVFIHRISIIGNGVGIAIGMPDVSTSDCAHSVIDNVYITDVGYGIKLGHDINSSTAWIWSAYCLNIRNCIVWSCTEIGYSIHHGTSVFMTGCYAHYCRKGGFKVTFLNYSSLQVCYGDHNGISYDIFDTTYYPVFYFYANTGFTVNSIGAEDFAMFIYCKGCRAFSLNNLRPMISRPTAYSFEINATYGGEINGMYITNVSNDIHPETTTSLLVFRGNLKVRNVFLSESKITSSCVNIDSASKIWVEYSEEVQNTFGLLANRPTINSLNNNKFTMRYWCTDENKFINYINNAWYYDDGTPIT